MQRETIPTIAVPSTDMAHRSGASQLESRINYNNRSSPSPLVSHCSVFSGFLFLFFFFSLIRSCFLAWAGVHGAVTAHCCLKLLVSSSPASDYLSAGITGVSNHTCPVPFHSRSERPCVQVRSPVSVQTPYPPTLNLPAMVSLTYSNPAFTCSTPRKLLNSASLAVLTFFNAGGSFFLLLVVLLLH